MTIHVLGEVIMRAVLLSAHHTGAKLLQALLPRRSLLGSPLPRVVAF